MKKTSIIFSLSLALSLIFIALVGAAGCQKHGINGDLDGMWQIMEVEQLGPEGEVEGSFAPDQRYICFQLHVCQLRLQSGPIGHLGAGNLTYSGNTVSLSFPYAETQEQIDRLTQWGIYSTAPVFTVEVLDRSTLVMSSSASRLICRRF
ncbi:MAG: lipocalin-like domain-containing protein [Muribaculaceae bacterium]|nr:lipocalin-like domain-containing protein [Muribaculaceae bacterium]